MKLATLSMIAFGVVAAAGASAHAQNTGTDQPNASVDALCWDALQNVARATSVGGDKLGATGELQRQTTGSSSENKPQGLEAEPKDSNRITSGVTSEGRMISGTAAKPPGIPDC